MSTTTTYSFQDLNFTMAYGGTQLTVGGQGIGNLTVSMTDNITESDLANDGSVMISKITSARGSIKLEIQQTSYLNNELLKWYNAMILAPSTNFGEMYISWHEKFVNGQSGTATGVTPMKIPDHVDQQQGQKVTWELFAANISQTPY